MHRFEVILLAVLLVLGLVVMGLLFARLSYGCDALNEPSVPPNIVEYNNQIGVEIRRWTFTWYTVIVYRHINEYGEISKYPFMLHWSRPGKPDEVWTDLATPPAGLCADLRKVR